MIKYKKRIGNKEFDTVTTSNFISNFRKIIITPIDSNNIVTNINNFNLVTNINNFNLVTNKVD